MNLVVENFTFEIPRLRRFVNIFFIKSCIFAAMEKFQNRYRIPSARASWWDYSADGCYFITICTVNHECLFGKIVNGTMHLSPIGKTVNEEWHKSFDIRKELFCDAFIIMPNHIHAILRIDNPDGGGGGAHAQSPPQRTPKSISSFVAGFKSAATVKINILRNTPKMPVWQPRFHDRIIRDENEYRRIIHYIYENPLKWTDGEFHG